MATSKLLRAAPPKNLDNYVASVKKLFGDPESIPDIDFLEQNFIAPGDDPNTETNLYISDIPLGFKIKINERTYSSVTIAVSGWMVLEGGPFVLNQILVGSVYENNRIQSTFGRGHILLSPWFDQLWPIPRTIDVLNSTGWYNPFSQLTLDLAKEGTFSAIESLRFPFDNTDRGVRYHRGYDKNFGRYFLCRWTTVKKENKLNCGRIKFETVIFENGRIEFRYWPQLSYATTNVSPGSSVEINATVGIFWNFPGQYKFRDFATLVDYSIGQRNLSDLGGAPYDSGYIETGVTNQPYSFKIHKNQNWPQSGAVIVFSPPANPYKVLPKKTVKEINSSKRIIRNPGLFDDRRTVMFSGNTNVFYPSTLPSRLTGDTGDIDVSLRQILFTSGSLKTTGRVNKSSVDTFLEQIEGTSHSFYKNDNSFNEFQKDYNVTDPEQPFFATGSSLSLFGDGFTTSLKSKTHFFFSLPVTKEVILPPKSSSLHYYNLKEKTWDNRDLLVRRSPESISIDTTNTWFESEDDSVFYYRVTETSTAFDSVGRKIVAGYLGPNYSVGNFTSASYQREDVLGAVINTTDSTKLSKTTGGILEKSYPNSFTDASLFEPRKFNKIDLSIDEPFLIEKVVVEIPFYAEGSWFEDRTTCLRPFVRPYTPIVVGPPFPTSNIVDQYAGPVDFGGPGITVALTCARKSQGFYRSDIIASGTMTHNFDNKSEVILRDEGSDMGGSPNWSLRPEGFSAFSNPTFIVSGTWDGSKYVFDGKVRFEMVASVAGGITYARNERSPDGPSGLFSPINADSALKAMTTEFIDLKGEDAQTTSVISLPPGISLFESEYNTFDINHANVVEYRKKSPRIYVQQVSPLSRGSTGIEFSGNSILGGTIASVPTKTKFKNPLFVRKMPDFLGTSYYSEINTNKNRIRLDAVSLFSTFASKPSPYLIYPKDSLSLVITKTRPVAKSCRLISEFGNYQHHGVYNLTGSHETLILKTGSIDISVYGSYVREGMEYHP
jgi:hypothetical protein